MTCNDYFAECCKCCGCSFTITATLDWSVVADLDLYVNNMTFGGVCYFADLTVANLNLNHDAYPDCGPVPTPVLPPEVISSVVPFTADHHFQVWYNQYSSCDAENHSETAGGPPVSADTTTFVVTNTGTEQITANGTILNPSDTYTLSSFPKTGFAVGAQPSATGADVYVYCGVVTPFRLQAGRFVVDKAAVLKTALLKTKSKKSFALSKTPTENKVETQTENKSTEDKSEDCGCKKKLNASVMKKRFIDRRTRTDQKTL